MPKSVFPLYTIPAEDALVRYLNNSCEVVYFYDRKVLTPSRTDLYWPSVVVNYNTKGFKNEVKLKKSTLFYRDHGICVYCETSLTENTITYDHLYPRSRGGKHEWENVVASCKRCNESKGNKTSWKPKLMPYKPTFFELLELRKRFPITIYDKKWVDFLPGFAQIDLKEHYSLKEYREDILIGSNA